MGHVALGLGVRDAYLAPLLALRDRRALGVLEIMLDDVIAPADGPAGGPAERRAALRRLGARWPLVAHGTDLGIGDVDGVDRSYVDRAHQALQDLHVHWYSEHLAFLRPGGEWLGHFGPVGDDDESLALLRRNAERVRAGCPCPLLLENAADVLGLHGTGPAAGPRGGRAYDRALLAADAGALLDLTNLALNARNDGYDPGAYLAELPWDRVVQVHLAGGHQDDGLWIDSHAHPVDEEALGLLAVVARRAPALRAVVLERDERLPAIDALLGELERARAILARAGRQ
jgi:uncharacterized protein